MKSASIAKLCMVKVARFADSIIIAVVDIGAIAISYDVDCALSTAYNYMNLALALLSIHTCMHKMCS